MVLDAGTGTQLWTYLAGNSVYSSPAVADGVLYVGCDDFNVYALDARRGAKLWSCTTRGYIGWSSPAVANGVVYVGSHDGHTYALNAKTGAKLWAYSTNGIINSSPAVARFLFRPFDASKAHDAGDHVDSLKNDGIHKMQ